VEDLDYQEMDKCIELYFNLGIEDLEHCAKLQQAIHLSEQWQKQANTQVAEQRSRLRSSLAGITFAVIVPQEDQRDKQWSDMCYKLTNPQATVGPVYMHKQSLVNSKLVDDPSKEAVVLFPWKPLGSVLKIAAQEGGEVSAVECSWLEQWYRGDSSDLQAVYSVQIPPSADKGRVTSYFSSSVKSSKAVYPESVGQGNLTAEQPLWSGHKLQGTVQFDWDSMQARVEASHPYLRVVLSGKWTFYRTEAEASSACVTDGPLILGKQKRIKTHYANLDELDMRVAGGALALSTSAELDWTVLLPYLHQKQTAGTGAKPKYLHWVFCEHLRAAIRATQFVGSPPTACSFGFDTVVYGLEPTPLTVVKPRTRNTVVWLDGVKKDRFGTLKRVSNWRNNKVVVVMSSGIRQQAQRRRIFPRQLVMMGSFPVGTKILLSSSLWDHTPKASVKVLEVWANVDARNCAAIQRIGNFAMPSNPLLALHSMTGGLWTKFHQESQDFKYRDFDGIVAATDGSVLDDPDEGPCMGGGVAVRAGDHGLVDEHVRVRGHISSLVAEGAAACVLLGMAPLDKPLAILTDSANVMYAMQHCSRREVWKDFSDHADAQLLEELARLQARRTANTVWVKIKSHASVELNERADRLAAEAPFAEDGISKAFGQQDDCNLMQFYKQGEQAPVVVTAQELKLHFIQLRSLRVTRNQTRAIEKLTTVGMGREHFSTVLWSETGPYSFG
jgi:ribonuclease HI